jgi:hypothetical protein
MITNSYPNTGETFVASARLEAGTPAAAVRIFPSDAGNDTETASIGVYLKADSGNTVSIFITSDEITGTGDGLELSPGEGIFLPLRKLTSLWVVSSIAGQYVRRAII